MKEWLKSRINIIVWCIFAATSAVAVLGWSRNSTELTSVYRLFPLIGLLAFSTMWGHYVVWSINTYSSADSNKYRLYSKFTHWLVLICILLHPGLIIYKLNADGFGLPPKSYSSYVGSALVGYVILGSICLAIFLIFELKKYLVRYKKVWSIVLILNHLAMLGIVIHALRLGSDLATSGFRYVWIFYGISLLFIYFYLYKNKKLF